MNDPLVCWKCGAPLDVEGHFARLEACHQCGAELHACVMCVFHEPHRSDACGEERAEPPSVKDRANFCDYFQPRPDAFRGRAAPTETTARSQLDALFGGGGAAAPSQDDDARRALDALFKPGEPK